MDEDKHTEILDAVGGICDGYDLNDVVPVLAVLLVGLAVASGNGKAHFLEYIKGIADHMFVPESTHLQ